MPVDYWDYLGWKDTFGTAKNTQRQRAYAAKRGDGMVYTPQAVINGRKHCNGAGKTKIEHAISVTQSSSEATRIPVSIQIERNDVVIEAGKPDGAARTDQKSTKPVHATVWLAVVQPQAEVEVRKGENRGHKLTYAKTKLPLFE